MAEKTQKQKKEKIPWLDTYGTLHDVMVCLIFVTVLFVFAVRLVGVVGDSMYPTLHNGDRLTLMSNFLYEPQVGDIVVLIAPDFDEGKPIVKRIIAMEGQTVDIDFETGEVWVDSQLLDEPYIYEPTYRREGMEFPLTVPENCVFVMGDNRNGSTDSRDYRIGCVDKRYVLGKAMQVVYPFSRFGSAS